jgi:pimeloyl-ACP methyl ester carboxylesterase
VSDGGGHCVVLVHGTWAPNSPWTLDGSPMVDAIGQAFGPTMAVRRFVWSGENSQLARVKAAGDLAVFLTGPEVGGFETVHIVGHSHGGTIASKACGDLDGRVVSLTTLSSPFFAASPLEKPEIDGFYANAATFVLFGMALVLLFTHWSRAMALTDIGPYDSDWHALAVGGVPILILWAIAFAGKRIGRWAGGIHMRYAAGIPAKYAGFGVAYVPTRPVYYELDEAYRGIFAALGLQRWIGNVQQSGGRLLGRAGRIMLWLGGALALCLFLKLLWWSDVATPVLDATAAILFLVNLVFFLGRPLVLYLNDLNLFTPLWTSYLANGPDSAFDGFFVNVEVLREPVGPDVAPAVVPKLAKGWRRGARSQLMHSEICFDPRAIDVAIEWIREHAPSQPAGGVHS